MRLLVSEHSGMRLPTLLLGLALLSPAALVAAEAPFEPVADMRITEDLTARSIRIPAGVTVTLGSDVILRAEEILIVEGRILAEDRSPGSPVRDGTGVHLQAGRRIEIRGPVLPGDGLHGTLDGQPGGNGGDLVLDAPLILSERDLTGGNGGHGGAGAAGGDGGSVIVRSGRLFSLTHDLELSATGGSGGDGGHGIEGILSGSGGPGGDGGKGGDAHAGNRGDGDAGDTGDAGNDVYANDGHDGRDGKPCENGRAGFMGFAAWGGQGGNGSVGGNATEPDGSGGRGGNGGNGGSAIAGDGGNGGRGGDCLNCTKAGNGGRGAPPSKGVGGSGGSGGDGGTGLGDEGDGGDGGRGGHGGNGYSGDAGNGGRGGNCCQVPGPGRIGGDGGNGGETSLAEAWGGHGATGGSGGNGGSLDAAGGWGGDGGNSGSAWGSDGGNGGHGGDGDTPGTGGNLSPGGAAFAITGGPGGGGGYPDGEHGDYGFAGTAFPGTDGDDGGSGEFCPEIPEQDENEEDHADGTWEDAYSWDSESVIPPDFGAFAQAFSSELTITGLRMFLTTEAPHAGQVMDLIIWNDDNGAPGPIACIIPGVDPGPVALWPEVSEHFFHFTCTDHTPVFWAGFWGAWPEGPAGWKIAADLDGPGGGNPMTRVAPGLGFPEGWQPVSEVFSPTAALGISVQYSPYGACCYPDGCCRIRTRIECESMDGIFLGAGTNCQDALCNPDFPDFRDHDIGECALTVTDQGILGFMDGSQAEGSGFVYPSGGLNHLYIGSLWVSTDPGIVANRDYDADPDSEWVVATCPAGQVTDAAGGLGDQEFRAVFNAELYPGRDLVTTQMSSASVAGPAGDFVIIRYQIGNAGADDIPEVYAGLFCDFDLNEVAWDDTGIADPALGLAVMTDGSGIHTAIRLLRNLSHPWEVHATLIHNPTFVYPNQYISDEDKYAFLAALGPDHILLEGPDPDDYGALVSTGPFPLAAGETVEIAFAVIGGHSMEAILQGGELAETIYQGLTADVPEPDAAQPGTVSGTLRLHQPAPNPTRDGSWIRFEVDQRRDLRLEIFDVTGRRVSVLADRLFEAGIHQVNWNGSGSSGREVPAGIYFVKLSDPAGGVSQVRRISLLR